MKLRTPYPYQQKTLDQINGQNLIPLFWEMRLGKSLVAIRHLRSKKCKRVLIVCPKSVIVSWKEELRKENVRFLVFSSKDKFVHDKFLHCWAITNYETLLCNGVTLHLQPWDAIILDESQRIKNPRAKISRLLTDPNNFPLSTPSHPFLPSPLVPEQIRVCLTGTPAPETYLEYFCQFLFLSKGEGFMGERYYYRFRSMHFQTDINRPGRYVPFPYFHRRLANYLSSNAHILTRKQVGMDLPNVYEKRIVQMSDHHRKIYDEFEKNWFTKFLKDMLTHDFSSSSESFAQLETKFATAAQSHLHQMACGFPKQLPSFQAKHKVQEVLRLLEDEFPHDKVVIWCRYLNDIKYLYHFLSSKRRPATITGETSLVALQNILRSFRNQTRRSVDTLICQIRKAGQGMDLSAADTQIFFSRSWSSMENTQATDRLIHPEKKNRANFNGLLTIDIITENTVDQDVYDALISKKADASVYKYFLKRTRYVKENILPSPPSNDNSAKGVVSSLDRTP